MAVRHAQELRDAIRDEAYGMRAFRCEGLAGFAAELGLKCPLGEDGAVFLDLDGILVIERKLNEKV